MVGLQTKVLIDDLTTGAAVVGGMASQCVYHTFYVVGAADITSGAVVIETAPGDNHPGTWEAVGTEITAVAGEVVVAQAVGAYMALRARISTEIAGGAAPGVTVTYAGI